METNIAPLDIEAGGCPNGFLLYNFKRNSPVLRPEHKNFLKGRILRCLENPNNTIIVASLSGASSREPEQLGNMRTSALVKYLVQCGARKEQVRIQSPGGSSALGKRDDLDRSRSVAIYLKIAPTMTILLQNLGIISNAHEFIRTIRDAFEPIVKKAGRVLVLERAVATSSYPELKLELDSGGSETKPCGFMILGEGGGGTIYVGAHRDLRVCCGPKRDPSDLERIDYETQLERLFEPEEPEFAHAIGNTAVHELAHIIADLDHVDDKENFMFDAVKYADEKNPKRFRTRANQRLLWGGAKIFSEEQKKALACAIHSACYMGGMTTETKMP